MVQTLHGQTMSVLDDRRQAQHWKTLQKFARLYLQIIGKQSTMFVRYQDCHTGSFQLIMADNLNVRCISVRFVPRLHSDDQKALRVSVCRELKQQARDYPNFISNIITGNETCVYGYDRDTKQQSLQWKSPNSKRPKKSMSSSQQCQVHVDCYFRHPRHCPQEIRTPWSNRQWQVLL